MSATDPARNKSEQMLDKLIAQAEESRQDIEVTIAALKKLRDQLVEERSGHGSEK